jgi:hypothetical protein
MTTSSFFGKYILSRNNPPKLLEMMMNSSLHDEFLNPIMEGIHLHVSVVYWTVRSSCNVATNININIVPRYLGTGKL